MTSQVELSHIHPGSAAVFAAKQHQQKQNVLKHWNMVKQSIDRVYWSRSESITKPWECRCRSDCNCELIATLRVPDDGMDEPLQVRGKDILYGPFDEQVHWRQQTPRTQWVTHIDTPKKRDFRAGSVQPNYYPTGILFRQSLS